MFNNKRKLENNWPFGKPACSSPVFWQLVRVWPTWVIRIHFLKIHNVLFLCVINCNLLFLDTHFLFKSRKKNPPKYSIIKGIILLGETLKLSVSPNSLLLLQTSIYSLHEQAIVFWHRIAHSFGFITFFFKHKMPSGTA